MPIHNEKPDVGGGQLAEWHPTMSLTPPEDGDREVTAQKP